MSRSINRPVFVKKDITESSINEFRLFKKLDKKTQMIRNIQGKDIKCHFTDRKVHTILVKEVCREIYNRKFSDVSNVNLERLKCSALLHDIGHTPFGHSCEDELNDLFLSNDKLYYSGTKPGLFKHNINSIKIISDYFQVEGKDYILIDSILKHTATFPKKYNYRLFAKTNILKCNYIFDKINFSNSYVVKKFVDKFVGATEKCSARSDFAVENNDLCYSCEKHILCFYKNRQAENNREELSMYLSYPYPLTLEGTILLWADEIACFVRDLYDFCRFIKTFHNKQKNELISLSYINTKIYLLKATYNNNLFLQCVYDLFNDLSNNNSSYKDYIDSLNEKLISFENPLSLLNILINSLDNSQRFSNDITINMQNGVCSPIFSLEKNTFSIFKLLKKSIYEDIHNIAYIKKTNEAGQKIINYLANYYYKHFSKFIIDYKNHSEFTKKYIIQNLAHSIMSVLGMTKEERRVQLKNFKLLISNWNFGSLNSSTLAENKLISKYSKTGDYNHVLNVLKREIGYFLATLSEEEILVLLDNNALIMSEYKEIEKLKKYLPDEYI